MCEEKYCVVTVCKEPDNIHDRHAVCVKKDGAIVGHVPRELSRTMDVFIEKGGVVTCTVTGRHKKGKGLEVPCVYCLEAKKRLMTKVQQYCAVSNIIIVRVMSLKYYKQHNGQWESLM